MLTAAGETERHLYFVLEGVQRAFYVGADHPEGHGRVAPHGHAAHHGRPRAEDVDLRRRRGMGLPDLR